MAESRDDRLRRLRELMDRKGLPLGVEASQKKKKAAIRRGVQVSDRRFPSGYRHGDIVLDDLRALQAGFFRFLGGRESLAGFDPLKAVYIDTETTGLAGGAGTYAFLVGAGFFEEDEFVVRQYFMPEPGDERDLLERFAGDFRNCQAVVTFNGARFDLPLLYTRFVMQGLKPS